MFCIFSSDLNLLLHLLAVLVELSIVLVEQVHLQLQLTDVCLKFLLELQSLCSAFHLHVQTSLQRLQRPLVTFSDNEEEEWIEKRGIAKIKCAHISAKTVKHDLMRQVLPGKKMHFDFVEGTNGDKGQDEKHLELKL